MTLTVIFTDDQYARFKAAMQHFAGVDADPVTDENLIAQMKREASSLTYAAEKGQNIEGWTF